MRMLRVSFILLVFLFAVYGGITSAGKQSEAEDIEYTGTSLAVSQDLVFTTEELFRGLSLTKEDFVEKYGTEYTIRRAGAEGLCQGYYYKKSGITVVFNSTGKVDWIECDDKANIYGARAGMRFAEIKEILGDASVREGLLEGYYRIFLLVYTFDSIKVTFESDNPDGRNSRLSIRKSGD